MRFWPRGFTRTRQHHDPALTRLSYGSITWERRGCYHYTSAVLTSGDRLGYVLLVSAN